MNDCFFCNNVGGEVLFTTSLYRIILIDDKDYPGYLRVILNQHQKEISDLSDADNLILYQAVLRCEKALRKVYNPDKINIASFGNVTPHVHWHIIPRFENDKHFPNPVWGEITHTDYIPQTELFVKLSKLRQEFTN